MLLKKAIEVHWYGMSAFHELIFTVLKANLVKLKS